MGSELVQYLISGISQGSIYAIAGLGFFIVYSVTRVINFTQGEFVMLGGMFTVTFYTMGIPLLPAIILAVIITGAIGGALYGLLMYPARRASPITLILLTIGAAIVMEGIAQQAWGLETRSMPYFLDTPSLDILGATMFGQTPWIVGTALLMVIGLFLFFEHTLLGKALRSCADNPLGARMVGISVERMALVSFLLAAILGAVAGAVMVPQIMVSVHSGIPLAIKGLLAAFIGGLGRAPGVIAGGLALGIAEAMAAGFIDSGLRDAIALGLLVAILLWRRGGLIGRLETEQQW